MTTTTEPRQVCRDCGKRTRTKDRLCPDCRPPSAPKYQPEVKCRTCPNRTKSKTGVCRDCSRVMVVRNPKGTPKPCHALKGGRWVPTGRGTVVWQKGA